MKFSVIIPAHNAGEYIRKVLDSVRSQVFTDYELIVVCDSCTDNTEEIAREYADKVIVTDFHRDGSARQAGLDAAEGEWIMFLDDDDWWMFEYVLTLADSLTNNADIVMFAFIWKGMGYTRQWAERVYPNVWSKAWRREFLTNLDIRFSGVQYSSDLEFTNRALNLSPRVRFCDVPIVYYNYMRVGSLSWEQKEAENERH